MHARVCAMWAADWFCRHRSSSYWLISQLACAVDVVVLPLEHVAVGRVLIKIFMPSCSVIWFKE